MQLVIQLRKVNFFHFFYRYHKFHKKNTARKQKSDKYYYIIYYDLNKNRSSNSVVIPQSVEIWKSKKNKKKKNKNRMSKGNRNKNTMISITKIYYNFN